MGNGIFSKSKALSHFAALAIVLSLGFLIAGNVISLFILSAIEAAVSDVQNEANLITLPIACAIIAAAFVIRERRSVENEANRKVSVMMKMLKAQSKLSDSEVDALYEGMRDLRDD